MFVPSDWHVLDPFEGHRSLHHLSGHFWNVLGYILPQVLDCIVVFLNDFPRDHICDALIFVLNDLASLRDPRDCTLVHVLHYFAIEGDVLDFGGGHFLDRQLGCAFDNARPLELRDLHQPTAGHFRDRRQRAVEVRRWQCSSSW